MDNSFVECERKIRSTRKKKPIGIQFPQNISNRNKDMSWLAVTFEHSMLSYFWCTCRQFPSIYFFLFFLSLFLAACWFGAFFVCHSLHFTWIKCWFSLAHLPAFVFHQALAKLIHLHNDIFVPVLRNQRECESERKSLHSDVF